MVTMSAALAIRSGTAFSGGSIVQSASVQIEPAVWAASVVP